MKLVYSDKAITVIEKAPGEYCESNGGRSIVSDVFEQNGTAALLVHRLDVGTGGLMVLANRRESAANLSRQIQDNTLKKEYLAVVSGVPEENNGVLTDFLFRDAKKNHTYVVKRVRKGVREAKLEYTLCSTISIESISYSLLRVKLLTGRTHQIRVQFASRKLPLYGDRAYGSSDIAPWPALHSCFLSFEHPETGEKMVFSSLPDRKAVPWIYFDIGDSNNENFD